MSSCLSGGGRAYKLDIEFIKPHTASWTSNSSAPSSSTLSESRNSPVSISTRKTRTPRKRPNQIYNEAAAILSTAYPKLFPTKHLTKPCKPITYTNPFSYEPSDVLMPFQVMYNSGCLLQFCPILERPNFCIDSKGLNAVEKACHSPGEISSRGSNPSEIHEEEHQEDLNTVSMLNEEIGEGIDSIMGKLCMENKSIHDSDCSSCLGMGSSHYGFPVGFGLNFAHGIRRESRATREGDEGDWWRFPAVNVVDITQKIAKMPVERKIAGSIKDDSPPSAVSYPKNVASTTSTEDSIARPKAGLLLKLNYNNVLNAWAEKGSPFCDDSRAESAGNDAQVVLPLFSERGEEETEGTFVKNQRRRPRHSSKKVRTVKTDQRPRLKGRYVRKPSYPDNEGGQ